MSKICPHTNSIVLYLECLECDDKICRTSQRNSYEHKNDNKDNHSKEESKKRA